MTGSSPARTSIPGFAAVRLLAQAFRRVGHAIGRRTPRFVKRIGAVTWALLNFTTDED